MTRLKLFVVTAGLLMAIGLTTGLSSDSATAAGCNESVKGSGRVAVGASASFDMQFCSDPGHSLMGWVTWGKKYNPALDMAVVVTSPSGVKFTFDDQLCAKQTFAIGGPLEEGAWTVDVVNTGSKTASFDLQVAFG